MTRAALAINATLSKLRRLNIFSDPHGVATPWKSADSTEASTVESHVAVPAPTPLDASNQSTDNDVSTASHWARGTTSSQSSLNVQRTETATHNLCTAYSVRAAKSWPHPHKHFAICAMSHWSKMMISRPAIRLNRDWLPKREPKRASYLAKGRKQLNSILMIVVKT